VTAAKVNGYIREAMGADFSTKDFRTWSATVTTAVALANREPSASQRVRQRIVNQAVREAARRLGNTVTVCRNSYVHPAVFSGFADGALKGLAASIRRSTAQKRSRWTLSPEERAILAYLKGMTASRSADQRQRPVTNPDTVKAVARDRTLRTYYASLRLAPAEAGLPPGQAGRGHPRGHPPRRTRQPRR